MQPVHFPYTLTNDYLFRALLQKNLRVLKGLICSLFHHHPEFYATYKLMNVKNNTIYSDKFILSVVDLNYINLATDEDKEFQVDYWASLFKATTWEEIQMLANNNPYIQEASETIYQLSADEQIREQCEARNAYYARERHHAKIQKAYEEATTQNQTLTTENKTLTTENEALKKEIESLKAQLAQK